MAEMNPDPGFWLFTFGYGHHHPETAAPLADHAVRFEGTYEEARAKMAARFGVKWAFQYPTDAGPVGEVFSVKGEQ